MRWTVVVLALALVVSACGGDTPTAPTPQQAPPPPPPPLPVAQLEQTGQPAFANCEGLLTVSCILNWSLQNVGPGCATQTTAVARLYNAADEQVGSDVAMGSLGGLYGRTIRPNEIVPLTAQMRIDRDLVQRTTALRLFPTWTNVRC